MFDIFSDLWNSANKLLAIPIISLLVASIAGWRSSRQQKKENLKLQEQLTKAQKVLEQLGLVINGNGEYAVRAIESNTKINEELKEELRKLSPEELLEMQVFIADLYKLDSDNLIEFRVFLGNLLNNYNKKKVDLFLDVHRPALEDYRLVNFVKARIAYNEEEYEDAIELLNYCLHYDNPVKEQIGSIYYNLASIYTYGLPNNDLAIENWKLAWEHLEDPSAIIPILQTLVRSSGQNSFHKIILDAASMHLPKSIYNIYKADYLLKTNDLQGVREIVKSSNFNELDSEGADMLGAVLANMAIFTGSVEDYRLALEFNKIALRKFPEEVNFKIITARCHYHVGESHTAESMAINLLASKDLTDSVAFNVLSLLGDIKRYDWAKDYVLANKAFFDRSTVPEYLNLLSSIFGKLDDYDNVLYYSSQALTIDPELDWANFYFAHSNYYSKKTKDIDLVIFHLRKVVECKKTEFKFRANFFLGKILFYDKQDLEQAKYHVSNALAIEPNNMEASELKKYIELTIQKALVN